jgi:ABC-type multidrug transport system permease subunit
LRESGQRVLSCLTLLLVAWSLAVLPRNPSPISWPRWMIQGSLIVMAVSMLVVGLHNSLDAREIKRRLRRAKIQE